MTEFIQKRIQGTFKELPDSNHVSFIYGIFTIDEKKFNAKKRKVDDSKDEDNHRVIVYGDVHSKSNFVKYTLLVTEEDEASVINKCGNEVTLLYTEDMETLFYRIDRVLEISTKKWTTHNITRYLKLNRKQTVLKNNLETLSGDALSARLFLKQKKVWYKGCRGSLYRDILAAARVCSKSKLYWAVCVYFPPHIVRMCHLQDDEKVLKATYDILTNWSVPSDICLYNNKKLCKYTFWEKQIQEIVEFWRQQRFFVNKDHAQSLARYEGGDQLCDFETRFKIVKFALNEKNLKKDTIFNFHDGIEDFEMEHNLLRNRVFYRIPSSNSDSDLLSPNMFGSADVYSFWDDWSEAIQLSQKLQTRHDAGVLYFVEGYPNGSTLKKDIGFVLNKSMRLYVKEVLDPESVLTLSDFSKGLLRFMTSNKTLDDSTKTIWFFGCEYYTVDDITKLLDVSNKFKCKVVLHFFGHYNPAHFSAKKFGLLDWFSLSKWREKVLPNICKTSEIYPEAFDAQDNGAYFLKNSTKEDVVRVAFTKKQKEKESILLRMLHDKKKTGFFTSVGQDYGEELISKSMQVVPNKSINTNKTFCVGYVKEIIWDTRTIKSIPKKTFNLFGKDVKVVVRSLESEEIYTPKDLVPSPVISFSEIIYPLRKVALVGEDWPRWAVEAFQKYLCTETIYFTDSFKFAEKDWNLRVEESIYTTVINQKKD